MYRISANTVLGTCLVSIGLLCGSARGAGRVILISIDGMRYDALDAANTPILDALIQQGSYAPWALNVLPVATLPNHATMLTGLGVDQHGVTFNTAVEGTIASRTLHDECADAGLTTGFYAVKNKLAYLAHQENIDVYEISKPIVELVDLIIARILTDPLDFVFFHSNDPDSTGHQFGWMSPEYLDALENVDTQIGRIVQALADENITDVHFIVTSDHGGEGMVHFRNTAEDRLIPWIAWGPGVAVGRTICGQVNQVDTPAMVLALLGVPIPAAYAGAPVAEAFVETAQDVCEPTFPFLGVPCMFFMSPVAGLLWFKVSRDRRRWRQSFGG